MNTTQFVRHVKKLAEENDIKFLLIAEDHVVYRGMIQEIISGFNQPNPASNEPVSKYTYYDIFDMIDHLPKDDDKTRRIIYFDSSDISDYPFDMDNYHIRVATNRDEFMVWLGTSEEPEVPIVTVIRTNSDEILISYMRVIVDPETRQEKIGSCSTDRISNLSSISGSLRGSDISMHLAKEVERFMDLIMCEINQS